MTDGRAFTGPTLSSAREVSVRPVSFLLPTAALFGFILGGCDPFAKGLDTGGAGGPGPVDGDDDTDAETDGDTDAGTDPDTDTDDDTDGDTDGDTDTDVKDFDCDASVSPPTGIDSCVDATLRCGDSIIGTTRGASSRWESDAYVSWYCFPLPDGDYAGGEVVYDFQHPGDRDVTITLEAPCEELDIAALRWAFWDEDGECPAAESTLATDCEADDGRGDGVVELPEIPDGTPYHYLVMVEGPQPVDSLYRLTVTCE